ncbi:ASCH domain-containing protein [Pareuzebyella sediminis]|uniref:ASCH domain-containing protein n=1 Tax=Pareuzebyella sediminis TaxID=2607998 RepID=UPI0011EC35C7|nr:ASCH domain-containing protein [Pareuzebyella sediminis]
MKHIALILLFMCLGCKTEPKAKTEYQMGSETDLEKQGEHESGLHPSVSQIWNDYIAVNPEFKDKAVPESDFFHNNRADADRLARLTLTGKKKASSGLYRLYKHYNVALPTVGAQQIVTDFDGKAMTIIENVSVDTVPFHKISEKYAAWDMGMDVNPLERWRKAHWAFFKDALQEIGEQPTQEMPVVCVRFKTVWPKNTKVNRGDSK